MYQSNCVIHHLLYAVCVNYYVSWDLAINIFKMVSTIATHGCNIRAKRGSTVRLQEFPPISSANQEIVLCNEEEQLQPLSTGVKTRSYSISWFICIHRNVRLYPSSLLHPILTLSLNFGWLFNRHSAFNIKAERTHTLHCQTWTAPFFSLNFFELQGEIEIIIEWIGCQEK